MSHLPRQFGFRSAAAERFPEMVVVGMSFVCNARCIHCPNAATDFTATLRGADRFMSWPVLEEIARQCAGTPTMLRVSSFGEILVHPEAEAMILHLLATKADRNVALTTNGSLLTADKAGALMAAGIRSIEFSVDAASGEVYETIRRGLSWQTLKDHVEACVALRDRHGYRTRILVSVIEQPANEDHLDAIVAYWQQRVDKVLTRKMLSFKGVVDRPRQYASYMPADTPCPFLWERVVVDPLGGVRGCVSDIHGELAIGNILETPLAEIWHAPEMDAYRRRHLAGRRADCPLCRDCVDLPFRSWGYNYFKAVGDAEKASPPDDQD